MSIELRAASMLASELRLPALPSELGAARDYAEEAAIAFGLQDDERYGFVFAVNEAVTNAIRHGAPDEQGSIRLSIVADADLLTFTVRDGGTFALPLPAPGVSAEGGRGLALMIRLVDQFELRVEPDSTTVRLGKVRS
jgi:anti-sigma regulatory factor (Ser/Thr protein kinase)